MKYRPPQQGHSAETAATIPRLKDRIRLLEEAGDALCENCNPSRWDSPAAAAQKIIDQSNWLKAKEAKL